MWKRSVRILVGIAVSASESILHNPFGFHFSADRLLNVAARCPDTLRDRHAVAPGFLHVLEAARPALLLLDHGHGLLHGQLCEGEVALQLLKILDQQLVFGQLFHVGRCCQIFTVLEPCGRAKMLAYGGRQHPRFPRVPLSGRHALCKRSRLSQNGYGLGQFVPPRHHRSLGPEKTDPLQARRGQFRLPITSC